MERRTLEEELQRSGNTVQTLQRHSKQKRWSEFIVLTSLYLPTVSFDLVWDWDMHKQEPGERFPTKHIPEDSDLEHSNALEQTWFPSFPPNIFKRRKCLPDSSLTFSGHKCYTYYISLD